MSETHVRSADDVRSELIHLHYALGLPYRVIAYLPAYGGGKIPAGSLCTFVHTGELKLEYRRLLNFKPKNKPRLLIDKHDPVSAANSIWNILDRDVASEIVRLLCLLYDKEVDDERAS